MNDWTWKEALDEERAKICDFLGYTFNRYGVDDALGNVIVEKFFDKEELDHYFSIDKLVLELEQALLQKGFCLNFERVDMVYYPRNYTTPVGRVTFSKENTEAYADTDFMTMLKKSLFFIMEKSL